jgi:hypothetical protein
MTPSPAGPETFVVAPSGKCLYHCSGRTRPRAIGQSPESTGWVYACPGGTVSTVAFLGGTRRPSPARVLRYLQSRTVGSERVRPQDLRAATRHGPELGRAAERWVRGFRGGAPIRLLYWRRYPRRRGRRYSYLYACFRHGSGEVRFYPAPGERKTPPCPFCPAKV